ncbi:MAG: RNA polymerase sigma factor [Paramuribaculum sp.]|nr:RNA polymerase sigma factor [Paramuribaculum sp.]
MNSRAEELMLIGRVVAFDDRQAFARLVDLNTDSLRTYIFNLTGGDAVLTADISQETFLKAYLSLRGFKGLSSFRTWLYRIAYHEYLDWIRLAGSAPETKQPLDTAGGIEAADNGASLVEMRHDISIAMQALTPVERSLITLFYYNDQPIKKISSIMSMPEGTVKVYLRRAKEKMAPHLQNYSTL